jgi:hypothetical protein
VAFFVLVVRLFTFSDFLGDSFLAWIFFRSRVCVYIFFDLSWAARVINNFKGRYAFYLQLYFSSILLPRHGHIMRLSFFM